MGNSTQQEAEERDKEEKKSEKAKEKYEGVGGIENKWHK